MKYKAIIFDMDGTIIDTEHIWKAATEHIITSKGKEFTPAVEKELSDRLHGLAMIKSCQIIKEMFNLEESVEDLICEKSDFACAQYKENLKFIEGFTDFYKEVISHNLKTGIATNADDATLDITKQALNLEGFFGEHIYNITDVNNVYKPSPDLYIFACKKLDVPAEECVAIEDSAHGIRAAKSAGMFCIGINSANNRHALHEADFIIDSYDEINLKKLLKK